MAVDLEQWAKDIGLNPDEVKQVAQVLGDERAKKVVGYGLRQSDYDQKMNDGKAKLEAERQRLKEADENLESGLRSVASLKDQLAADLEKGKVSWQEAERRAIALEATVRRLATEAGTDPDEALKQAGIEAKAVKTDDRRDAPPDWEERLKAIDGRATNEARHSFMTGIEMEDVADEHRELFGTRLSRAELVAYASQQATRGRKLTPQQAWEEKYEVGKKREELRASREKTEREQLVKDTETRVRSEMVMSGGTGRVNSGPGMLSPVLQLERKDAQGNPINQSKPGYIVKAENRLRQAVADVQAGKVSGA